MDQSSQWEWKSSMLNTPGTLFDFLNMYDRVPKNRLRVFFATSRDFMNAMLERENIGLLSNSVTVEQFLKSRKRIDGQNIRQLDITRKLGDEHLSLQATSSFESANYATPEARGNNRERNLSGLMQEESERSRGGDYDTPYTFALPVSMRQALAWTTLLAKVQRGELEP